MSHSRPERHLPLSPAVFQILLSLADGDRHGYAIMQDVEARSGGGVQLGPGTLYGAIKRLMADGIIEERAAPEEGDERRRIYHLTKLGRRVAELEAERLERLVAEARAKRLIPLGRSA